MSELLTKKELARRLKVTTRTIDRWRSAGIELGAVRIRGVVRFRSEALARLGRYGRRPVCVGG